MKSRKHQHGRPEDGEVVTPAEVATALPASFDWREHSSKAVTPVYDQGQCGSCWAFSAVENVESVHALAGNPLVQLSVQQVVDCDTGAGDEGCNGGDLPTAFAYIAKAGLEPASAYHYTAADGKCKYDASKVHTGPAKPHLHGRLFIVCVRWLSRRWWPRSVAGSTRRRRRTRR